MLYTEKPVIQYQGRTYAVKAKSSRDIDSLLALREIIICQMSDKVKIYDDSYILFERVDLDD